jgi:hypothetical protein
MVEFRKGYKDQAALRLQRLKETVTDDVVAAAQELSRDLEKASTKMKVAGEPERLTALHCD